MTLQTNPDGISRAVAVISAGGCKLWTDADRLTSVALKGSRVVRNRRGNIVEIHLEAHHEAAIASHISRHNKGEAFRQPLQVGWVWALTGVQV